MTALSLVYAIPIVIVFIISKNKMFPHMGKQSMYATIALCILTLLLCSNELINYHEIIIAVEFIFLLLIINDNNSKEQLLASIFIMVYTLSIIVNNKYLFIDAINNTKFGVLFFCILLLYYLSFLVICLKLMSKLKGKNDTIKISLVLLGLMIFTMFIFAKVYQNFNAFSYDQGLYLRLNDGNSKRIETLVDMLYFSVTTMTSVGYNDIFVKGSQLKIFVITEQLIGFLIITLSISFLLESISKSRENMQVEESNCVYKRKAESKVIYKLSPLFNNEYVQIVVIIIAIIITFILGVRMNNSYIINHIFWITSVLIALLSKKIKSISKFNNKKLKNIRNKKNNEVANTAKEIRELYKLKVDNIITEEEFTKFKKKLFDEADG